MTPYLPSNRTVIRKALYSYSRVCSRRCPTQDMAHGSEDAVDPQLSAAARTRDHGDFILLMRGASEVARWPPKWSLKAGLIVD
jgi:hypothetical protein